MTTQDETIINRKKQEDTIIDHNIQAETHITNHKTRIDTEEPQEKQYYTIRHNHIQRHTRRRNKIKPRRTQY